MQVVHVETGRHLYGGAQQALYLCRGLTQQDVGTTLVCGPGSAIDRAARECGITVENLACAGDLDALFGIRLRSLLSRLRPDLVHCHSRRGADIIGGRAAASLGIPAVLTRRVDSVDPGFLARIRYRPFTRIVAISENVASALRESGVPDDRITVIRSAVDALPDACDRRLWQDTFGFARSHVVAIVVAQFIARKGHRFLFDAMKPLCERHPEFRVLLFGEGPLRAQLEHQRKRLGLDDHVQFAGFRDDLDKLFACADMLVHPATKEGLGVAMLKAAAAGLPVIAFDVAGAREAVVHRETGLLVPTEDVAALLHALTELVENPEIRQVLGRAGKDRMANEFSVETMVRQYVQLYRSMLDD